MMPNWLGDAVMAEPSIRAIQLRRTIAGVVPDAEKRPPISMLEGHPAISSIAGVDDRGFFRPARRCGQGTCEPPAPMPCCCSGGVSDPDSPPPSLASAPGSDPPGFGRQGHADPSDPGPPPRPTPCPHGRLLCDSGRGRLRDHGRRSTAPTRHHAERTRDAAARLLDGVSGPVVGFVPGGSKLMKRWPADRFAELARRLGTLAGHRGPPRRARKNGTSSRNSSEKADGWRRPSGDRSRRPRPGP